ncbi:thioredoxin family protein [Paenibacillus roseipurpureus]|uniref:Thioredoxin family protein n=1 Tax=Paenibacillus roseopurpureus TaxID=2918901 RepID=A0AA96LLA7_9BACL|nr:thioredoxin family protein [Paenibacillus sp. MBLB1832]WNR42701.1 thioredoxin family protein [Paenibacillus sp. MBLB1832]
MPDVEFFEIDVDEEEDLASRWRNQSIPYFIFFYNGQQVKISSSSLSIVDGGLVGAMLEHHLRSLVNTLLASCRSGSYKVLI